MLITDGSGLFVNIDDICYIADANSGVTHVVVSTVAGNWSPSVFNFTSLVDVVAPRLDPNRRMQVTTATIAGWPTTVWINPKQVVMVDHSSTPNAVTFPGGVVLNDIDPTTILMIVAAIGE